MIRVSWHDIPGLMNFQPMLDKQPRAVSEALSFCILDLRVSLSARMAASVIVVPSISANRLARASALEFGMLNVTCGSTCVATIGLTDVTDKVVAPAAAGSPSFDARRGESAPIPESRPTQLSPTVKSSMPGAVFFY